jgi:hypothetical protein
MNRKSLVTVATVVVAVTTLVVAKAGPIRYSTNPSYDVQRKVQQGQDPNPTIRVLLHDDHGDADLW